MKKLIDVGRVAGEEFWFEKTLKVTLEIELRKEEKGQVLSICGNVWNLRLTDILAGGQINNELRRWLNKDKLILSISKDKLSRILDIWDRWHLNNLNTGCEHQKKLMNEIRKEKGEDFFYASNYDSILKIPAFNKCPECGYKYGSAWMFEPLPNEVIEFVEGL